ncbi:MAG: hypothetical protein JWL59_2427 [Chthoniobacteraceae bacterium]|nr:hypothetical protein [Chthoniobacteraceae bacterium]
MPFSYRLQKNHPRISSLLGVVCALLLTSFQGEAGQKRPPLKVPILLDLNGQPADPFRDSTAKLLAFVFTRTDCPISNTYAPEIRSLSEKFAPLGVVFYLVYPGADESAAAIREHLNRFNYPLEAFCDPQHIFSKKSRVCVTPEAAVFRPNGKLLYHGRLDNRYVDFGKARPEPTVYDLQTALKQALAGQPVTPASEPALGCFIEEVK